jgi:hypothetical protein
MPNAGTIADWTMLVLLLCGLSAASVLTYAWALREAEEPSRAERETRELRPAA